jgi:hypothetical protein
MKKINLLTPKGQNVRENYTVKDQYVIIHTFIYFVPFVYITCVFA